MRATWAMIAAGSLLFVGCAIPDENAERDVLEPLYGPVGSNVLTQRAEAPVEAAPEAPSDATRWRVSNVLDGRTLEIYQGLERATATLGGIEVPTDDECLAGPATDSLTFITGGGRAFEISPPTPRNGRIEGATIIDDDGQDLAAVMLSLGLARVAPDTAGRAAVYDEIEATARADELGIWAEDCDE